MFNPISKQKKSTKSSIPDTSLRPRTIFCIPNNIVHIPKEKEKKKLREMGKMKYISICTEDDDMAVRGKIFKCFPHLKEITFIIYFNFHR